MVANGGHIPWSQAWLNLNESIESAGGVRSLCYTRELLNMLGSAPSRGRERAYCRNTVIYAFAGDGTPSTVITTIWSPSGTESGSCMINW